MYRFKYAIIAQSPAIAAAAKPEVELLNTLHCSLVAGSTRIAGINTQTAIDDIQIDPP